MIHNGECRIDLNAGLLMRPTKVVQGVVDVEIFASQSQNATPAPARIVIKGKHAARVLQLLGMNGQTDAELAERFKAVKPELAEGKDDAALASDVRSMILDELLELRGE